MDEYVEVLVARGPFSDYFAEDVRCTVMGEGLEVQGREAAAGLILSLHTQSFDARPELKRLIVGEDEAALEAVFIGTHTGEYQGIPATGKAVSVPYSVHYDLQDEKINALRIYMSMDALLRQIGTMP
jgi:steroid delta-isomerase-like uncharacterized protein